MSISTTQYALTATPVEIVGNSVHVTQVTIHNHEKGENIYAFIGTATVSSTTGIHLDPGGTFQLTLQPMEKLFAVTASQSCTIGVLMQVDD